MSVADRTSSIRSGERFTLTERQYRRIADAALFTATLIIFTGAAVRLTGSGLGCPNWPKCTGNVLPALDGHALIEYGNRLVTGVVGLPCLAAAIGAYRLRPVRPELKVPALLLPIGVGAQGILGGITVMTELDWQVVIGHYLLSLVLLIACVTLVWRVRQGGRPVVSHPRATVLATRVLVVFGAVVLVLGTFATAAGPHAGGAGTGDFVGRLNSIAVETMIKIHGHAAAVFGGAAVAVWLYAKLRGGATPPLMRALTGVAVGVAVLGALGLIQYHNALPAAIVWAHVSTAAVLWIALVFSWLAAGRARA